MSAGFQLVEDGERIQLPHGGFSPEAVECEMELIAVDFQFVVGELEIALQPFQESWLENSAAAVERVAGEPDKFRFSESQFPHMLQLLRKFLGGEQIGETH